MGNVWFNRRHVALITLGALFPRVGFGERVLRSVRPYAGMARMPRNLLPATITARADGLRAAADAAHGWNWLDPVWWANQALTDPFQAGNHSGVDLLAQGSRAQDGWELYIRRVLTIDGLDRFAGVTPAVRPQGGVFFILYNRRTGVLRTFIYSSRPVTASDRYLVSIRCSANGTDNVVHQHGNFNLVGPIQRSLSEAQTLTENTLIQYFERAVPGWLVLDILLGYVPVNSSSVVYLSWHVKTESSQNVKLAGQIQVRVPVASGAQGSWLSRVTSVFGDTYKSFSSTAGSLAGAAGKIAEFGQRVAAAGGSGQIFAGAASVLGSLTTPIAAAVAGSQFIRSIVRFFSGGGGVSFATYDGTITLQGQIISTNDHEFAAVVLQERGPFLQSLQSAVLAGIPRWRVPEGTFSGDVPYYLKVHPGERLGLLALSRPPRCTLYKAKGIAVLYTGHPWSLDVSIDEPIEPLVELNPAMGLSIKSLQVQLIVERPFVNGDQNVFCYAPGVTNEVSPVDSGVASVFREQFHPPVPGERMSYVEYGFMGRAHSTDFYRDRVFLRTAITLAREGSSEEMECVFVFRTTVTNVTRQVHPDLYPPTACRRIA